MIENIARYLENGETPYDAAHEGAKQIGFTILSLTVSLVAVLIPLLFMGDLIGRLFREFALTLTVAIFISAFVSLTFTPMLAARIFGIKNLKNSIFLSDDSAKASTRLIENYRVSLVWVLNHQSLTLIVAIILCSLPCFCFISFQKAFFQFKIHGVIQGISEMPQSISFQAMTKQQQALAEVVLG